MPDYRYLIVGGGMTADAACRGIRDHDPEGSIGLIGAEPEPPYSRPPLSKALWQGKSEDTIWRGTVELGVELHLGRRAVSIDRDARVVTDDEGERYGYEQLLLATGGSPRRLPEGSADIVYFRTVADYRRLRALADAGGSFVVLGGGFIGSEVAAGLRSVGAEVTLVFPEDAIGARVFPADLAEAVTGVFRAHGVEVIAGGLVAAVAEADGRFDVTLQDGRVLSADGVVAGLGIIPETALAEAAGLELANGIVVDELGRAAGAADVFAAGDVAQFPSALLGVPVRVEHEDQANSHGRAVGANMAGAATPYTHHPFFYSDLFELGYEAIGETDSRHEMVAEWIVPLQKGVVAYLADDGCPRGFLLLDVWGKIEAATALIAARRPLESGALAALIA